MHMSSGSHCKSERAHDVQALRSAAKGLGRAERPTNALSGTASRISKQTSDIGTQTPGLFSLLDTPPHNKTLIEAGSENQDDALSSFEWQVR